MEVEDRGDAAGKSTASTAVASRMAHGPIAVISGTKLMVRSSKVSRGGLRHSAAFPCLFGRAGRYGGEDLTTHVLSGANEWVP